MSSITASYTSASENKSFEHAITTDKGTMYDLTESIKLIQTDINQYLTSRMAANNENMDTSKEEAEAEGEEDEEEDEEEDQRPDTNNNNNNNKKQKTSK
ncbi:hypothetical protein BDA99DRAFT_504400 [Phascolomyces articulosus]|uniref:EKC/KEOPS complex subunit GON7 n=1 Tax=Phascolomyces articulosus TaxID=60185 RepID=A0AAD5KDG9_9FUNG|nr:hypothetical protein BDA99DRAFT_504400 [Phascolomyces articulosus]